jgi:hypothetical protein
LPETILLHVELDRLDRIGRQNGPPSLLVCRGENSEHFEFVMLRRAGLGIP